MDTDNVKEIIENLDGHLLRVKTIFNGCLTTFENVYIKDNNVFYEIYNENNQLVTQIDIFNTEILSVCGFEVTKYVLNLIPKELKKDEWYSIKQIGHLLKKGQRVVIVYEYPNGKHSTYVGDIKYISNESIVVGISPMHDLTDIKSIYIL